MKSLFIATLLTVISTTSTMALTAGESPRKDGVTTSELPILGSSLTQLMDTGWSITSVLNQKYLMLMGPGGRRPAICEYVIDPKDAAEKINIYSRCYQAQ